MTERLGLAPAGSTPREPSGGDRNWPVAIGAGLVIAIVALAVFWLGPVPSLLLATLVIFLSGAELLAAFRTRRFKPLLWLGWAAFIGMPLASYYRGDVALGLVLFLVLFFGFLWYIVGLSDDRPLANLAVTFLAVAWVGMFGSYAALILRIPEVLANGVFTEKPQGVSILILAIIAAVLYDVGGALFGKFYGKTRFTPISPNKTIEGLLGGVGLSIVSVAIVGGLFHVGPFSFVDALFFGFCCALAAPIGDLAESLIKRDLGLKDMSSMIPGHGGVLDRFDALLFVLPVAYYVARVLLTL